MTIAPGQCLSHYEIVEKLGEGGMGVVWRAQDRRLQRDVAIKFLAETVEGDLDWLTRLAQEARAVAALSHPNIVTIHSLEEEEGRRFLVMELVQGRTLDEIVHGEGASELSEERLLDLAIQMVDAIRAAHARGVVHGDIKPSNIMIDDDGRLKILDFGMAKHAPPPLRETPDSQAITLPHPVSTHGHFAGTLSYMSPEQIRSEPSDARSDIFSLGVVLYEMATAVRPFAGDGPTEQIAAILRDTPPPIAERRKELSSEIDAIVGRALEKAPDRRYQTALDMQRELERLRANLPLETRGVRDRTASELRSVAVLPLEDLWGDPRQAWFADGMTDALINSLARIGALKVISRTSVMPYKGTKGPLPETARALGVDAIVEGSVLRAGERVRIAVRLVDAARDRLLWSESYERHLRDVLAVQSRVARAIADRVEIELTPHEDAQLRKVIAVDPAVHEAYLKGRHFWYKRTSETVLKGLRCFEEAVRLEPGYAPAWAGIADSYIVDGGRYLNVTPDVAYARAREAARKAVALDDNLADAHTSLAAVLTDYDWDWEEADREYRRAIELNPNYVVAHSWYAEQLSRMGRHDDAVAEAWRARDLDPLSLASNMIVAWILYFARRYDESIAQARKTLELDADFATAHRILGWAYEESGQYERAIASHRRASELTDHQPNFEGQLGRAYALAGRHDEALEVLQAMSEASTAGYVSSLDLAIIECALGRTEQALRYLERAYEEKADHLPYSMVNPRLDPLRGEPRFRHLLQRMGLTESATPVAQ